MLKLPLPLYSTSVLSNKFNSPTPSKLVLFLASFSPDSASIASCSADQYKSASNIYLGNRSAVTYGRDHQRSAVTSNEGMPKRIRDIKVTSIGLKHDASVFLTGAILPIDALDMPEIAANELAQCEVVGDAAEGAQYRSQDDTGQDSADIALTSNPESLFGPELIRREEKIEGASGSEQHLAVFGAKIPLIELAIKRNASRFQQVPIGPVGAHVKLRGEAASNPDLARLVETELSRAQITSYLCNSDEDRRQLSRLLDDVYGTDRHKPRIFTSKFIHRPHNVIRPAVSHNDTSLLMDLLHIENPVVFNHLVDQKSIESVLVCRSQDTAKALMTRRENVPANVNYAVTHDFYRFYPPRDHTSYRSYYMEALQGSGMLRSTMSNLVAERSQEMRGLEQHLNELQQEMGEVGRSKKSYEAEKKRAMAEIQKLRSKVANINSQVSQVKAEEDNAEDNAEHISTRLVSTQSELIDAEEKIQDTLNEREMLTDLLSEKEDLFKRNKKELNELKSSTNPLLKEQREIETQITNKTKEILNQEKLVKKLNSELDSYKSELIRREEEVEGFEGSDLEEERSINSPSLLLKSASSRKSDHFQFNYDPTLGAVKKRQIRERRCLENYENYPEQAGACRFLPQIICEGVHSHHGNSDGEGEQDKDPASLTSSPFI